MRWYICSFSSFLTKANVCTSHRYCLKPFKWSLAKASKGGCIKGAKGTSFVSTIVQYKCKFVDAGHLNDAQRLFQFEN